MIRFFLPGPVFVSEEVAREMMRPIIGHRSEEFRGLYREIIGLLQELFGRTPRYAIFTCSATGLMEAVFLNLRVKRTLCLVGGAFAARWREIAGRYVEEVDELRVPEGQAVDPEQLRAALKKKEYGAVTITHSETSTGVLAPLPELMRVAREESEALVLVDAVSSWGGVPVPLGGIDYALAGSQKALALPPGISLMAVSDRFLKQAEKNVRRSYYFDLPQVVREAEQGEVLTTPAIPHFYALRKQLVRIQTEGLAARFARHEALLAETRSWAREEGLTYFSRFPSPTVSCLEYGRAEELVRRLKSRGYVIGGGYGALRPRTFRIGHMGEVDRGSLKALLTAISEEIHEISRAGG